MEPILRQEYLGRYETLLRHMRDFIKWKYKEISYHTTMNYKFSGNDESNFDRKAGQEYPKPAFHINLAIANLFNQLNPKSLHVPDNSYFGSQIGLISWVLH
ncbi:hypothetical protein [Dyadobacter arcticus]|uniref:Uncharacterized protein n=1 Tax=Dyadobacter arcticus TaxID=1078754 RepID=A0ABX0UP02_9BACT|nr:hypothetical protein [Dyadobacter arcticus]NIJ54709.1 hypothetical protein [Dyadobacter arcticus]